MRATITFDEKLFEAASAAAGTTERSTVIHEALRALVERDATRRLTCLGGSDREASVAQRRRSTRARSKRRTLA